MFNHPAHKSPMQNKKTQTKPEIADSTRASLEKMETSA
jgi:hypothetical protein